jgi:hypothetical protein
MMPEGGRMTFLTRRTGALAAVVLALSCVLSISAWGGGAGFGDDDDNADDAGPPYFGFVRDSNGATVPDAKVTISPKSGTGIITRTDALGTYKLPGFSKEIDPKDVQVSCDKNGYKQIRVVRRSSPSTDPKIPIETECTLQRI